MAVRKSSTGFTMIEMVIFIVVIGIGLTGILGLISVITGSSADPMVRLRGIELGQAYLDEILPKRFDEATPEGGTPRCGSADTGSIPCTVAASFGADGGEGARSAFDDVDDYHLLNDNPPQDEAGVNRPGYAGYTASITVSYAGADLTIPAGEAKRIDVAITTPQGDNLNFSAYRANF